MASFENTKGKYLGEDKSTRMIFDFRKVDYLIKMEATPIGAGNGHRDGSAFVKFVVNDKFKWAMDLWHDKEKRERVNNGK